jgi:hypothetical protein
LLSFAYDNGGHIKKAKVEEDLLSYKILPFKGLYATLKRLTLWFYANRRYYLSSPSGDILHSEKESKEMMFQQPRDKVDSALENDH